MCGIVGTISFEGQNIPKEKIKKAAGLMAHRGPDDDGFLSYTKVNLGFRRLAIIDLSHAGHQPMSDEKKNLWIIFNGEIYNFKQLRDELKKKGYRFQSGSDTEVILKAYQEYGSGVVDKVKGMFAFAIFDKAKRQVFLARDRFGIKPLYYYLDSEKFIFASEIKAILEILGKKTKVDLEAFNEYFTFQNIFSDKTLFQSIHLLPPAHFISIDIEKKSTSIRQYWEVQYRENSNLTEKESMATITKLLEQAVERHMIADVPVGSYLSGGMDSASIVALASKRVPHLMSFTGGFDISSASGIEQVFDEREDAEVIARTFKTEHYEMIMRPGDMARVMKELIWNLEDLRVGMCYPNYYIARLASRFVKVALSGAGGDELFAGYPWRYKAVEQVKSHEEFNQKYYTYWSRLIPDGQKKNSYSDQLWNQLKDLSPYEEFKKITVSVRDEKPINKALFFEFKTFLHGLLVVEDKVSMAHSLEVRVPFLDYDLVDFAATIPANFKVKKGIGKYILRRTLSKFLPQEITEKTKQGFSPPDESWYRGESLNYVKDVLFAPRTLERGFFKSAYIKKIVDDHTNGKANNRLIIWSLLSFEWWCRNFLD